MNTLELEAYKAALAREVLNINNQEVLDTIKDIIQRSGNLTNAPYQIGVKEARKYNTTLKHDDKSVRFSNMEK